MVMHGQYGFLGFSRQLRELTLSKLFNKLAILAPTDEVSKVRWPVRQRALLHVHYSLYSANNS